MGRLATRTGTFKYIYTYIGESMHFPYFFKKKYYFRHVGDLGNVVSEGGKIKVDIRDRIAMLSGKYSV